ncbi:RHS repeat-associated core domain-containing protein [Pseudomonas sp. BW13M1]|uniref:RHS repeat-associated core domain-containing protein n=1 Tax=Pseudomonas peradeniyensis TaxID=2745488 RepID=A0A923GDY3_9PSED|nr:RHS repeat-associated core domain-containing protein [Pseudomonas peradeniyensis]
MGTVMGSRNELDNTDLAYTAYGHETATLGPTPFLRFNGQFRESVNGAYLLGNGYRGFNPVLMRFSSPDSYSPFGDGDVNAYAYCGGNPVFRSDPSGHIWRGLVKIFGSRSNQAPARARSNMETSFFENGVAGLASGLYVGSGALTKDGAVRLNKVSMEDKLTRWVDNIFVAEVSNRFGGEAGLRTREILNYARLMQSRGVDIYMKSIGQQAATQPGPQVSLPGRRSYLYPDGETVRRTETDSPE